MPSPASRALREGRVIAVTDQTVLVNRRGQEIAIVGIPKTPGEYEMSLQRNMTFVVGDSQNLIATKGRIVVDEVTATSVKGGLVGTYDGQNEVNGRFEVTICPD